jgi:hypothetical protein
MNNGKESQNERIEKLLGKARLPEPSPILKERITTEAKKIWNQAPLEIPWLIPVRRLVASVAAAVLIIWLANVSSDYSVARWQVGGGSATTQPSSESEILPELPYGSFVRNLVSISRELPATDGSGLGGYRDTVRQLLDEAQKNDTSVPSVPAGSRSRLLPEGSSMNSYS